MSRVTFDNDGNIISGYCHLCKSLDEAQDRDFCSNSEIANLCEWLGKAEHGEPKRIKALGEGTGDAW